jgi:hypothetical protein
MIGQVSYYYCHRSGKAKLVPEEERRRALKSQGSVKINALCPAFMVVHEHRESKAVSVQHCCYHVGHDKHVMHLPLSTEVKLSVANKLLNLACSANGLGNLCVCAFTAQLDCFLPLCVLLQYHNDDALCQCMPLLTPYQIRKFKMFLLLSSKSEGLCVCII